MKESYRKYLSVLPTLLFGLAVFLFWLYPYRGALNFQEQYQLFLFDAGYLSSHLMLPGGVAAYIARFLTQFYFIPWIGALIIALTLVSVQLLHAALFSLLRVSREWYALTFLPSMLLWVYMGDENVMLAFPLSLAMTLTLMVGYLRSQKFAEAHGMPYLSTLHLIFSSLVGFWAVGPNVLVYAGFVALFQFLPARRPHAVATSLAVLVGTLVLLLAAYCVLHYPLYRIFGGLYYYRYPAFIPVFQIVIMVISGLLVPVVGGLPHLRWRFLSIVLYLAVIAVGLAGLHLNYDAEKYRLIDSDYLVRTQQWDKIIDAAVQHQPTTPMGVAAVNLALSQKGQLCDRLFDFYQNGAEGLFPAFQRDMITPLLTAEVFFRLGMVNDAQRYVFEAQEAIPDFQKSGRCMQRLAQTNMANGQYAVARKYLHLLERSLFYRAWAEKTEALLGHEAEINRHPTYSLLRQMRQKKTDYLFSDQEMDQMLGLLFVGNYRNKMAYEYMMAYELLQRDLDRFRQYYPLGRYVAYDHIPKAFQEILVGLWLQQHSSLDGMPYTVDAQTVENTTNFIRTYMADRHSPALGQVPMVNNAWHYILLGELGHKKMGKEKMKTIY